MEFLDEELRLQNFSPLQELHMPISRDERQQRQKRNSVSILSILKAAWSISELGKERLFKKHVLRTKAITS